MAAPWAQEPRTVFGIELGANFDALNIPDCPSSINKPPATQICIAGGGIGPVFELGHLPDFGFNYRAHIITAQDASITAIRITAPNAHWNALVEVLRERYGAPSKTSTTKVTNMAGAAFDVAELLWVGSRTTIMAVERSGRVDECTVDFNDMAAVSRQDAAKRQRAKESAGKL
jgi:hypothetical protein